MRLFFLIFVTLIVLIALVEGKSWKDSKSDDHDQNSSKRHGKVTKVKQKPIRHHSSDSSESSEEIHRHKSKKKHSDRFRSEEERSNSRKTTNHRISLKNNSSRTIAHGSNNRTGKLISLTNYSTFHKSLKFNETKSNGHENKTLIGWKIFVKPNMSKTNNVNETNKHDLNSFLNGEKGVKFFNSTELNPNNNKMNNSGTAPSYGWKNFNSTLPSQGWKNFNASVPSQGWKNFNATGPKQGWNIHSDPVQGLNIQPSAPDFRKDFSFPDQRKDQKYFFDSPGFRGYQQKNPNSIGTNNQPVAYPQSPDYNRKTISDIAPVYGWGIPQTSYTNNNQDGKMSDSYPLYRNYESSEKSSSKLAKGAKKLFKKLGKGVGEVLSGDQVKDAIKQTASSYFANPPPNGWIYDPPYGKKSQTFYGSISKPIGKESMSADDWRSLIFGNVPRKADTRNLYSAAFPETYQNFDLNALSEKGRLPDFNHTQYKSFFPRPYYQKIFAGLHNEEINENFRTKRELSEKGKAMADVINKFFLHERDCNDTVLDARRKRHVMVRPLTKNASSGHEEEKRVTNFPFSGVEAIIQSDNIITVYEEAPKEIQSENNSTQKSILNEENTSSKIYTTEKYISTTESGFSVTPNRTKLYPVYETIEQFLKKKPATRLRAIDESLETWKSKSKAGSNTFVTQQTSEATENTNSKRIVRSDDISVEGNTTPFYIWMNNFRYGDSEESSENDTDLFNEREIQNTTPRTFLHDSNEHLSTSPEDNSKDEVTTSRNSYESIETSISFINDYNNNNLEKQASKAKSEEISGTTPLPESSTGNDEIHNPFMETTLLETFPTLIYSNHEAVSTEKIQITSEPNFSEYTTNPSISKDNNLPEPTQRLFLGPFKVLKISSISHVDDAKKKPRSTFRVKYDPETVTPGASIIRAPNFSPKKCGSSERWLNGKCRMIYY